jgi:hypothetical protein
MRDPDADKPALPGRRAFLPRVPSLKDGLLLVPYALKLAAALAVAHWTENDISNVAVGAVALALAYLGVIAALAFGAGRALKPLRLACFAIEMTAALLLFRLASFHAARGGRGDEVGLVYGALTVPLFLLALIDLVGFEAERKAPRSGSPPGAATPNL